MNISQKRLLAGFLAGLLAGCVQSPRPTADLAPAPPRDPTAELVFHALAADIAARRGLLEDAFDHYIWVARETKDAAAAEKAARIGLHLQKNGDTLYAASLWTELAPEDIGAHEVRAAVFLREGRTDEAYTSLLAIVELSKGQGHRGFVEAAGVVTAAEDPAAAKAVMARLAGAYPRVAEAHYANALVLLALGDVAGAEREARAAVALDNGNELAWMLLSRIRAQSNEVEQSGAVLKEAVTRNPDSRLLRVAYGRWLVEMDRFEAAYAEFRRLHAATPEDPDVLFSLGALATDLGYWDAARGYWKRLMGLGERVDEARYFLAQVEEAAGNDEGALVLYASVQDGPLRMEAAIRRAELLARIGDIAEARRVLAEQRVLHPERSVPLYLVEAEMLRDAGRAVDAAQVYDTALQAFPDNDDLLYARAMHAASEARIDVLERDLRSILKKDPDHADALNALGYTLADQTDRYEEAFDLISRALKLKPENAAILDSMGWVQYRLGNLDAALEYLGRAADKDEDSEIAAHLGEVLWVTGRRDEALRVWNDALTRDPQSRHVREAMDRLRTGS